MAIDKIEKGEVKLSDITPQRLSSRRAAKIKILNDTVIVTIEGGYGRIDGKDIDLDLQFSKREIKDMIQSLY